MLERLKLLEENIKELLEFKKRISLEDIQSDKYKEWALRYGFVETIQIVIDIACHLVSKYNLGNPSTYSECIELLQKYSYIDENLTVKLLGMVGLRNILIHEYLTVDKSKLYDLLNNVDDIRHFIQKIKDLI
ncbi:MAG: DUF86 domain-containing protein [Nitrospirae bacterium]|nr:DUF86 domain-containing protein [Nitrospirota bacterium]